MTKPAPQGVPTMSGLAQGGIVGQEASQKPGARASHPSDRKSLDNPQGRHNPFLPEQRKSETAVFAAAIGVETELAVEKPRIAPIAHARARGAAGD
jgi:hypothetical protein